MRLISWVGIIAGLVLLGGGLLAWLSGASSEFIGWMIGIGAVIVAASLIEPVRYKRLISTPPGPGWVATAERFRDPATGRMVQVYMKPESGERLYVDVGAAADDKAGPRPN